MATSAPVSLAGARNPAAIARHRAQRTAIAALIALTAISVLVRLQAFGNPVLEFDEQFYRLVGERMLHGAIPYVDLWDRKPVGLFLIFAAAARLFGETAQAYQFMAMLFVGGTGWAIWAMARQMTTNRFTPFAAAILYILWLDLLEGEGGQSPVFFELPVCLAALFALSSLRAKQLDPRRIAASGLALSMRIGLAAQIKYTVALEGVYFGLVMLSVLARAGVPLLRIGLTALGWCLTAIAPTLLAWLAYVAIGHGHDWLFANFLSVLLRQGRQLDGMVPEFIGGAVTVVPLMALVLWGGRRLRGVNGERRFLIGWAIAAFVAILALRSFEQHYWMPLVPPLALLALPALERSRRFTIGFLLVAALLGQVMIGYYGWLRGTRTTLETMVAAMGDYDGCIFVFDGFPALYAETRSCLPSRWSFPGHISVSLESKALGVDPEAELLRILAQRPPIIVRDEPVWEYVDPHILALLKAELARHYRLVRSVSTGTDRRRLVYKRTDLIAQ